MCDILLTHLKNISGIDFVPDNWEYDRIGNRCTLGRGRVISQIEINKNPGLYPVYSSQTTNNGCMGYLATNDFEGEYATWTTDGANAGTVFYRKGKFNCTNVCGTIQPKSKHSINLEFFAYHLNRISKCYVSYHGNPKLMNDVMANIAITFPPYKEQHAIATILNTLDNTIQQTQALVAKLKQVKAGMLHDLLTRGLDENGELRDPVRHPEQFKESTLGKIPKNWKVQSLGDVLHKRPRNGFSPKEISSISGVFVLGLGCLTSDGFKPIQLKPIDLKDAQKESLLQEGDLLISRANTSNLVALPGIYEDIGYLCAYPDLMMRLVPKSCILSKFMELMIRHSQLRDHLVRNANGTSASMVKINSTTVVTSKIAYPELSEQVRILSVVTPYNKKLKIFEQESDKLRILKQALMQDLLTGKVRVPEKMMEAMP